MQRVDMQHVGVHGVVVSVEQSACIADACVCLMHKVKCLACVRTDSIGRMRVPVWCSGVLQRLFACIGVTWIIVVVDFTIVCVAAVADAKVATSSETQQHRASN